MAASQCPKCSHLFDLRDGFGDLLPLAYCSACDSYYAASIGSCKWCGTTPEPPPNTPRIWKAVGGVAFVALAGLTWLLRGTNEKAVTTAQQQGEVAPAPAVSAKSPAPVQEAAPQPAVADSTPVASAPAPEIAPVATTTNAPPVAKAPAKARWVSSVARNWVIVRAGPSRTTRIVASVGPGARVQLGESKGDWRRIRARGIAGWVEPRAAFASAAVPPRSSRAREVVVSR